MLFLVTIHQIHPGYSEKCNWHNIIRFVSASWYEEVEGLEKCAFCHPFHCVKRRFNRYFHENLSITNNILYFCNDLNHISMNYYAIKEIVSVLSMQRGLYGSGY